MKRIYIVFATAAMALATLAPIAGAAPTDFRGSWTAVDSIGWVSSLSIDVRRQLPGGAITDPPSNMALVQIRIPLGKIHAEEGWVICPEDLHGAGIGDPSGKTMTVTFAMRCGFGWPAGNATITFIADQGTLTDTAGNVWSRN